MNECLVTVIVPAYNHERYILECLEGIANQTYKNYEWIITDDNSSDRTPEILKEYQPEYGYTLILNKKNVGVAESMTNMIKRSKGKYVFPCASDDIYMPTKIEKQLALMENNPQFGMCYSRVIAIDENSKIIRKDNNPNFRSGYIFEDLLLRKFNPGAGVAFRKSILEKIGYYASGMMAEDYYMNCQIARICQIGFLDDYLIKYRVVDTSQKRDPWTLVMSHRQTVDMFKDENIYPKAVQAWEIQSVMILSLYKKYKNKALKFFMKNCKYYLLHPKDGYIAMKFLLLSWR